MSAAGRGGAPEPIPLTVLTGFLGAGKTTLLNQLLRAAAFADTLVLINEFGEAALDNLLIEAVEGDVLTLAGGCLCCSVRSDLVAALEDMLRRRDNGRIAPFRRVVLETSGLADPVPVLQALLAHRYLPMRYALDGVIAVVDAVTGPAALEGHEEARRQAALADRIVLTKTDLLRSAAEAAPLRAQLAALAPGAPILDAARGEATAGALTGIGPWSTGAAPAAVAAWLAAMPAGEDAPPHRGDIRTATLWSDAALSPAALPLFVDLLRATSGPKILRLKGLVRMADDPDRPMVLHGVQHLFHPPSRLPAWPDSDRRSRLVVIGRGLDANAITRLYDAFAGVPAIDAPDAAALTDNPLVPFGGGLVR